MVASRIHHEPLRWHAHMLGGREAASLHDLGLLVLFFLLASINKWRQEHIPRIHV
jgi:hypothetical protein